MNLKTPQAGSHSARLNPMASVGNNRIRTTKRRSSRMALNAPVGLSGEDRHKCSFTMSAKATNLNRHGAAVQLNRELRIGSVVLVRNGRGTQLSARVVTQLATVKGVSTYAIEFVDQDDQVSNFWGITFPSTNAE
jgi:hypothetical protein